MGPDRVPSRSIPAAAAFALGAVEAAGLDADQWYDTLSTPPTPLVADDDDVPRSAVPLLSAGGRDAAASAMAGAISAVAFAALRDEHESDARKRRARRKRASDSAFKARRSSRLASKEAPLFTDMLTKAKLAMLLRTP